MSAPLDVWNVPGIILNNVIGDGFDTIFEQMVCVVNLLDSQTTDVRSQFAAMTEFAKFVWDVNPAVCFNFILHRWNQLDQRTASSLTRRSPRRWTESPLRRSSGRSVHAFDHIDLRQVPLQLLVPPIRNTRRRPSPSCSPNSPLVSLGSPPMPSNNAYIINAPTRLFFAAIHSDTVHDAFSKEVLNPLFHVFSTLPPSTSAWSSSRSVGLPTSRVTRPRYRHRRNTGSLS